MYDYPPLPPEQRRAELVRILARGVLRHIRRASVTPKIKQKLSESAKKGLDVPGDLRTDVSAS